MVKNNKDFFARHSQFYCLALKDVDCAQCRFEVAHLRACRQRTCTCTDINRRRRQVRLCQTRTDRPAARCESKVAAHWRRGFGTD